jgi:hypothetical protein
MSIIHSVQPVDNFLGISHKPGTLVRVTLTTLSVAQRDPGTLLRRIGRHVPFDRDRIVLALVRLSRSYVDRASWIDAPAAPSEGSIASPQARALLRGMLTSMAPDQRVSPPSHAVAMVRCRPGRVVWLPSDEAWLDALARESELSGLPVAEVFLVTEHGWRCHSGPKAGQVPALAA